MHPSYRSKFLGIETELNKLFESLSGIPFDVLDKSPAPGAWSVMEVMQHMMVVEKNSLAYVKKKTSFPASLLNARFNGFFNNLKLYIFLYLPVKVKAPPVVNESQFEQDLSFEELMENWRATRVELMDFLEAVPEEWHNKLAYRHTFAGRLTLDGMLIFFKEHFARHIKQINRTLKVTTAIS